MVESVWFLLPILIIRLVPIGSAECGRMFSLMNRIKTDLRSSMGTGLINGIIAVNRLAPGLGVLTLPMVSWRWIAWHRA